MHLTSLEFTGYRNLPTKLVLSHPLAVVVGANNVGKSNAIDAMRMLLQPLVGWPLRLKREDFAHDGHGAALVDELVVTANFEGLNTIQAGRMVTALDGGNDRASLHLQAVLPDVGPPKVRFLGGESKSPDVEDWARTAVTYTYLPPLRDAEEDLRPGRNSRLVELIGALAGDGPDKEKLLAIAQQANSDMGEVDAITSSLERIQGRLDSVSGAHASQTAELMFTEPAFDRVLSALGVRVGDAGPLPLSQNGLGLNNVLYMAVLLAALTHEHNSELHLVLVEEPEAHLHPQMQDLLMRFLQREVEGRDDLQIVVTTHSPNFASAARVERVTSMSSLPDGISASAIESLGLMQDELDHLARFLDVTKAALLFARSVILVEGLAEQLLLPVFATEMGLSLAESSVTVVNVGGLAFGPFAALFDDGRLPNRCAILSDSDPPSAHDDDEEGEGDEDLNAPDQVADPDPVLSATAEKLVASENDRRKVFLSSKTFEHDLVTAGNWPWAIAALALVKPRVAKRLLNDATLDTDEKKADALLNAVKDAKGRFAQALTRTVGGVKAAGTPIVVPPYIASAIEWAVGVVPPDEVPAEAGVDPADDLPPADH